MKDELLTRISTKQHGQPSKSGPSGIVENPDWKTATDEIIMDASCALHSAPEMPFFLLSVVIREFWGVLMATTSTLVELQKLRETAESLRRIAGRLPPELSAEIIRLMHQIEDDAVALQEKLQLS